MCDLVVLSYIVRRTVALLYGGPDMAFPFPWRRPQRRLLGIHRGWYRDL